MPTQNKQTASFMVRFNQSIYDDSGEAVVQWRGKVSHVQDGDAVSFTDMSDAMSFIQDKLTELTKKATSDRTREEQEGIVEKSLEIWKKVKATGPKLILDTLKDPKKQVSQIQDQIQDQISQVGSELSAKVELDQWRAASKSDFKQVKEHLASLNEAITALSQKVDNLSKDS